MAKMSPDAKEFYKARIGNVAFVFLLISYGLVYALQFVLDLTVLLSIIAAFIGFVVTTGLTLYLYVKGAYKTKKNTGYKQLITMATFLIEMFPEVDLIPGDVIDVVAMFILTRIEDREAAEAKAIAVQQEAQMQQVRAVQFAEYAARQQQVEIEEEQEQIEEDEVVAANDNAIAAANDNEIQEEADTDDELEEFPYPEAA